MPHLPKEQMFGKASIFVSCDKNIERLDKWMKSPCQCNGQRKKCTFECSHVPNFRKECTPTCGFLCAARRLARDWKPMQVFVQKDDKELADGGVLIAGEDAQPGRLLTGYSSIVVLKEQYEKDWKMEGYGRKLFMEYYDGFVLDGKIYGSEARFARHSCTPNCDAELWYEKIENIVSPLVVLIANQQIKKGDELTYTYNVNNVDYLPKMVCFCGKSTCPDILKVEEPKQ